MATDTKRKAAEALLHVLPLPGREAGWAREARAAARTRLLEAGAPARRDEYWKYTDPTQLTAPVAVVDATDAHPTRTAHVNRPIQRQHVRLRIPHPQDEGGRGGNG